MEHVNLVIDRFRLYKPFQAFCPSAIHIVKPTIHEATFVAGDTTTLLFVRAAHGNIAWYILQVTWK